ncbi:Bug family tripartite tricarboxylate transporter substrate binding protein [uncultured Enterovirga sp.]|uniref:Bug family tripartite tricarboxylate transporter substrate binding protein n=1 Tax=uncultured Enterovirga sp. TaxID=2026352 RepID=UPI0035CBEADA
MPEKPLSRRSLVALGIGSALIPHARADEYPSRVVTIIVPFAPGGSVDLVARAIAEPLGESLGRNVIVENRAGASAAIGTAAVARAAPDGYTLLVGSTTSISIRPLMQPPLPYDTAKDLMPVVLAASVPHVLLVSSAVPARSVAELVAFAQSRGRPLTLGDSGVGSPHSLAGDLFAREAGLKIDHVPYKGTSAVVTDLLAGHIDFGSIELSIAAPHMQSGSLKAIGLSAAKRDPAWPQLPTIAEQGIKDYEIVSWFGIFAPARTPPAIIDRLSREITKVMGEEKARKLLVNAGLRVTPLTGPDLTEHLARERRKWGRAIELSEGKS